MTEWFTKRRVFGIIAIFVLLVSASLVGQIVENVGADEIVVIQSVRTGELSWYTTPGPKLQLFGKVTIYKRRSIYEFEKQVRFNDGAHANMIASIQYELPLDEVHLNKLHKNYVSQEGVQNVLVAKVVDKCTYMTGPTMSSQESYASKRNLLIEYVEDQVGRGVYRTQRVEGVEKDSLTGQERKISGIQIMVDAKGLPQRIEEPVLANYGITASNFSISDLKYDKTVEDQIAAQQKATMDVQLGIAESKKAEQRKLTTESEGAALAAKAKWEQEAIRAKEVTRAEQEKDVATKNAQQRLDVAALDTKAAEQYKLAQILKAEGDAEYKKRVMLADGALAQKLDALVSINASWASAFEKHQGSLVPSVVMAGDGGNMSRTGGAASDLVQLMTANAAKSLALDMSLPKQR